MIIIKLIIPKQSTLLTRHGENLSHKLHACTKYSMKSKQLSNWSGGNRNLLWMVDGVYQVYGCVVTYSASQIALLFLTNVIW